MSPFGASRDKMAHLGEVLHRRGDAGWSLIAATARAAARRAAATRDAAGLARCAFMSPLGASRDMMAHLGASRDKMTHLGEVLHRLGAATRGARARRGYARLGEAWGGYARRASAAR